MDEGLAGLLFIAILLVVALGLAAIVWQAIVRLPRADSAYVIGYPVATWLLVLAAPWVIPFLPEAPGSILVRLMLLPVFAGAFMSARQAIPGVAVVVAIAVLAVSAWIAGASTLIAYKSAWQGLDIDDPAVSGFDMGEGANVAIGVVMATVLAPFAGFVIGLASQIGKRAPAASAGR